MDGSVELPGNTLIQDHSSKKRAPPTPTRATAPHPNHMASGGYPIPHPLRDTLQDRGASLLPSAEGETPLPSSTTHALVYGDFSGEPDHGTTCYAYPIIGASSCESPRKESVRWNPPIPARSLVPQNGKTTCNGSWGRGRVSKVSISQNTRKTCRSVLPGVN
jgi:hypothetical protein